MSIRSFVYISKSKIEEYTAQISPLFSSKLSGKLKLMLGVLELEVSQNAADNTDIQKLQKVIDYLHDKEEIGTIEDKSAFFAGEIYAHAILLYGGIFFFGIHNTPHEDTFLGLSCSTRHMIGVYEYPPAERENEPLGLIKARVISATSGNAMFAHDLMRMEMAKSNEVQIRLNHEAQRRQEILGQYRLNNVDKFAIQKYKHLNRLILLLDRERIRLNHEPLLSEKMHWLLKRLLSEKLYRRKIQALNKLFLYNYFDRNTRENSEKMSILLSVKTKCDRTFGIFQNYEYVAKRILDGKVEGKRVVLGSPLYLALK
jgi:hypothetical protein